MSYPGYQYVQDPRFSEEYLKNIKIQQEKNELKKTANSVGLVVLLCEIIFSIATYFIFIVYMLLSLGTAIPPSIDSIPENVIGGLANVAVIGVCGAVYIKATKANTADVLLFNKISFKKLVGLVAIGFTVSMLSNLMTNIFLSNAYYFGINLMLDIETPVSNSWIEILVYFLSTAIVPAFSEEILFRGAILSKLRKFGDSTAIFVSAFLFGLFHGNFIQFPFAFVVGLVLAWTVVYANSMLPAILIHMFNNGFSVLSDILYTNAESLGINEAIIDIGSCILVIVVTLVAIIATASLAKRDKKLFEHKKYDGLLDNKTRTKHLILSPTIIVATILLLAESVYTHIYAASI